MSVQALYHNTLEPGLILITGLSHCV